MIASALALLTLTAAAPIKKAEASSMYNIWVNGQQLSSSDVGLNPRGLDIRVYAAALASNWTVPADSQANQVAIISDGSTDPDDTPTRLYIDYSLALTSCSVGTMDVIYHGEVENCPFNGDCPLTLTSETTTTDTRTSGYKTSISVEGEIGFDVELVEDASISVTATAEYDADFSTTITNSTTVQRQYNLQNGDTCAPTTIQYSSSCTAAITVNKFEWQVQNNGEWLNAVSLENELVTNICPFWDTSINNWGTDNENTDWVFDYQQELTDRFSSPDQISAIAQVCGQSQLTSGFQSDQVVYNYGSQYLVEGCSFT